MKFLNFRTSFISFYHFKYLKVVFFLLHFILSQNRFFYYLMILFFAINFVLSLIYLTLLLMKKYFLIRFTFILDHLFLHFIHKNYQYLNLIFSFYYFFKASNNNYGENYFLKVYLLGHSSYRGFLKTSKDIPYDI